MTKRRANPITVLISDPDIIYQQILRECLQSRYEVLSAQSLASTLNMLLRYHPRILLLEMVQPDGDGIQLIQHIHNDPGLQGVIIACLTKHSSAREKANAFRAGADDFIVKPINPDTFAARLSLLLRLSRLPSWRNVEYQRPEKHENEPQQGWS